MLADKFFMMRLITKESTKQSYRIVFNKYCNFHQRTLEELLEEAEKEEEERIPLKQRKIKENLLSFQLYLSKNYTYNTVQNDMGKIKTFYRTNEIELPYLPPIKIIPTITTTFEEILTKDQIKYAFEHTTNHKLKALIIFMLSSGTAINETTKLTIQDFIEATKEYHNSDNIVEVLQELKDQENIIPTFFIVREKKSRPYYTFCSPEATRFILTYLKYRVLRKEVKPTDLLFEYTSTGAIASLIRLNDNCNFARKKNGYRRFHSHGFRKFFSTNMLEAGMSKYDVDFLCGRKADTVSEAYFQVRPERRKKLYERYMSSVIIFDKVNYIDITSQEKQHYEKLKDEINKNKQENKQIKQMLYDLQKLL